MFEHFFFSSFLNSCGTSTANSSILSLPELLASTNYSFYEEKAVQSHSQVSLLQWISVELKTLWGNVGNDVFQEAKDESVHCSSSPGNLFIAWLCFVTITTHQKIALKIKLSSIGANMFYFRVVFLWNMKNDC